MLGSETFQVRDVLPKKPKVFSRVRGFLPMKWVQTSRLKQYLSNFKPRNLNVLTESLLGSDTCEQTA